MGCCCQKNQEPTRTINFQGFLNPQLSNNKVITTKYSLLTFLPKAIIIQFVRPANFVYLISAILQSIPIISSLTPVTAIAPFIFVIGISLVREGYEDYKRYQTDKQINQRNSQRLSKQQFADIQWQDILVGDIIRIRNGQTIPADILLLHTSQQNSLCYVQTANLDGQTNLKAKYAHVQSIKIYPHMYQSLRGTIVVDSPNCDLHSFSGTIQMQGKQQQHIDFQNILLRQTVLKNTDQAIGVVIYTGYDTKIVQNQGKIQNKVSNVQRKVNVIQFFLLIVLILLSATCSIGFYQYHSVNNNRSNLYHLIPQVDNQRVQALLIYFSSFLLLTFLIPISLNVSIEVIKAFLGIFLSFDEKMYYEPIDKKCNVNNVSILQELGTIDYVLTDKTGTLTANQMVFRYLLLGKKSYRSEQIQKNLNILKGQQQFRKFWIGLVICHDVVNDPQTRQYEGSSPDEVCFINYARTIGYEFVKRTKNSIQLLIQNKKVVYQLLQIIAFDSRKRMSVIVKNLETNQIVCYTKGADSAIFSKSVQQYPNEHEQIKSGINQFAKQGYRTLLFSYRILDNEQYENAFLKQKSMIRESKLLKKQTKQQLQFSQLNLIQKIQSNLILLGATAIEDRLQDHVPRTIHRLQESGIVVMMITGDKLQTAQNIGYLANFIKPEAVVVRLQAGISDDQMIRVLEEMEDEKTLKQSNKIFSLIIEGSTISKFLNIDNQITKKSLITVSSVIFCRSSPKQKGSIVTFVKQKLKGIVLAIGDGGNDVGMIQVANVGVGILGKQGNSASVVSDFSIGQFKFLDRLVLHHGRWFYYRLSYFFVYYGWKNLIMTLILYFFMIDSAFSAFVGLSQPFIAVYNILIGLALVVYYSIFEQDINDDQYEPAWQRLPVFYKQTKQQDLFSYKRYIIWSTFSILIAIFIFCTIKFTIGATYSIDQYGHTPDITHQSEAQAISLSIIVVLVLIMDIKMYTKFSTIFVIGFLTILGCVIFFVAQNYISSFRNYYILQCTTFRFWLVIILNVGTVYAGKTTLDMIHFLRKPTEVQEMIAKKTNFSQSSSSYINLQAANASV